MRLETIEELAKYHNLNLGVGNRDELLEKTKIKEPMKDLEAVLGAFWTTQKVLCSYEDFKDIYLYAYKQGLKGCTTFRFNPEAFQGVLDNAESALLLRGDQADYFRECGGCVFRWCEVVGITICPGLYGIRETAGFR